MWSGCVRLRNTRVSSRARQRGMSETATSLQDVRLRRESREPALPLDWISVGHEEEKGGEDIPASRSMNNPNVSLTGLFSWFSFLQLVLINQGAKRSQTTALTSWPPSRCQTTCALFPSPSLLLWLFIHLFWLIWTEPKSMNSSLGEDFQCFLGETNLHLGLWESPYSCYSPMPNSLPQPKRSRDPHPPSFLTQKQ